MATARANPDILKHSNGIEMWMWLCVEREIHLGSGGTRKILRKFF